MRTKGHGTHVADRMSVSQLAAHPLLMNIQVGATAALADCAVMSPVLIFSHSLPVSVQEESAPSLSTSPTAEALPLPPAGHECMSLACRGQVPRFGVPRWASGGA